MKKRIIAALLAFAFGIGIVPGTAWAAESESETTATYLLAEGFPEESLSEEQLEQGTVTSEENASTLFPTEESDGITGVRNVLVAAVRFQGEMEFVDWSPSTYNGWTVGELMKLTYDGTNLSVSRYYEQQSFGQLQIRAIFLNDGISSIQLSHDRSYYEPLSLDNPEGYLRHVRAVRIYSQDGTYTGVTVRVPELACQRTGSDPDQHVWLEGDQAVGVCEHMDVRAVRRSDGRLELVCSVAEDVSSSHTWSDSTCFYSSAYQARMEELDNEVYSLLNALAQEQGIQDIDCVNLWYNGLTGDWSDILWPHQSYFEQGGTSFYRDGARKRYIQQFASSLLLQPVNATTDEGEAVLLPEMGTLTHELGHMLGFPDYYSYYDLTMATLGTWSLMCEQSLVPQNIHAWAAYTYGKWLDDTNVQEITEDGYYTLTTISGATQEEKEDGAVFAYYLENPASDPSAPEQIVMEYRTDRGDFEGSEAVQGYRAASGIILYSVDMDADQRLAGNMAVSGKDGRYGAKLYWRSGASEQFLSGYSSMSQGVRDIYDMIFSVLTDQPYLHRKEGQSTAAVGNRVYGSSDLSVTENALVSRRTGQNSGIVVCSPTTEPDESQMTLWVDLDCPEVTAVRQSEDGTQRTVVLCFDEPIQEGEGLANLTCVSAQTEGNRLILTLDSGTAGETLTIPADAVTDQVGRGMAEAYTVSLSQAAKLSTGESVQFSDVADGYWAVEAISAVSSAGLFRGVTDETFQPGGTLTRGMFVTVLGRMVGVEEGTVTSAFSDVADDAWYAPYVNWAAETGIVTGKADGIFAPEDAITREEMAVMLERFLTVCVPGALAEVSGLPFSDQDQVSDWAQEAVRTLESNGLMNGSDGAFRPKAEATRAEAAALLSRCMTWVMGE